MNRPATSRILAGAAAVAFAVTTILAGTSASAAAPDKKKDPKVTITALPAQVKLLPGEKATVTLETNVTTGYQWSTKVVGKEKGTVVVSAGVYTAPTSTLMGAPGTTTWTVTAVKKGTAVVKFLKTPPGQTTAQLDGSLTVIVLKKK